MNTLLTPHKTITVNDLKILLVEKLHKIQEYRDYFAELKAQRKNKEAEIIAELQALGKSAEKEVEKAFSSSTPAVLSKFEHQIHHLASKHLMTYPHEYSDKYQGEINFSEISVDDIQPIPVDELFYLNKSIFPEDLEATDTFPASYVKTFETVGSHAVDDVITDLWNTCLALKGESYRISDLSDIPLKPESFTTPYFVIKFKVTRVDECDFFMQKIKFRVDFSEEMLGILSSHKLLFVRDSEVDEDDF